MNKDLESYACEIIAECACVEEFIDRVQQRSNDDVSEDCKEIWSDFWSKEQDGCLDCD